ncbi:MAG: diguanylate cyclase [Bradyrhizobium sp.]|nr:diguanylate cyclase [Bradyrhizobium sp.]
MSDQFTVRGRTLLAGKIVSDFGQSSIDCVIRRMSDHGATLQAESHLGIPTSFHLLIAGEGPPRAAKLIWQSGHEIGVEFEAAQAAKDEAATGEPSDRRTDTLLRGQMLTLRSAMDEIETGVVLLDSDLRSQFINKAFRKMWTLPDAVAESKPSYVALMFHGRDIGAYEIAAADVDAYVASRISAIRSGDTTPRDVRCTNGEVIRVQCAVLPNGGRMLSYTYVTDIVRHSDELELLRNALDNISEGVMLLDANLKTHFLNHKLREYFSVTPEQIAARPDFRELITHTPPPDAHSLSPEQLATFYAKRVEAIRAADPPLSDVTTPDGRHVRVQVSVTANGGRLVTYCNITDLILNAELLEKLATVDSMTGLYNRRHFMVLSGAEWGRFQRYQRPLSMLMLDIDHFKSVNDRYGHAVGDEAIISVAAACQRGKRNSDIAGRLGGEEFAILLPETDAEQALVVAERIRESVAAHFLSVHKVRFNVTVSVGIASASISMSGIEALLRAADEALYQAKEAGRNRVVTWSAPMAPKLAAE